MRIRSNIWWDWFQSLEKSGSLSCTLSEIQDKLDQMVFFWEDIKARAEEREIKFLDVLELAEKFWYDMAALLTTIKDTQDIAWLGKPWHWPIHHQATGWSCWGKKNKTSFQESTLSKYVVLAA